MQVQIASDLHHEFARKGEPGSEALPLADGVDMLVLAGDIHSRAQTIGLYGKRPVPVLYVHGNYEMYATEYFALQHQLRTKASGTSLHFLERDEFVVDGVRFLGAASGPTMTCAPSGRQLRCGKQQTE